jgi:hypothetical protein
MRYGILSIALAAMALALLVGSAALAADQPANSQTHEGTVVSVAGGKLVVKGQDGKEHTNALAANATLTCDGAACKLADLKVGQRVRVTMAKEANTVSQVEALDKNKTFSSTEKPK